MDKKASKFAALKAEFAKIFWPDKTSIGRQTVAVVLVTAIMGVLIVFFDMIIQFGLDKIFQL